MDKTIPEAPDSGRRRDWRKLLDVEMARAKAASAQRRARVLKHPDLAAALTRKPLGYTDPQQWSGFVPPLVWRETGNGSARRAALVEIATAALARERAS
jgi:hypothetical protein